jgi:hypothetical protein
VPIPKPNPDEDRQKFISRCMSDETMKKEYTDNKQRIAVCLGQTKKSKGYLLDQVLEILGFSLSYDCVNCKDSQDTEELLVLSNLIVPKDEDYVDFGEATEEYDLSHLTAAEYQGRKVTLNKPFRTPDAKKKFAVYVRNKHGKVIIVRFGSQEMSIKRDDPKRRKSFRARHKCDQQKDKTTPAYWSCWQWRANSPVQAGCIIE